MALPVTLGGMEMRTAVSHSPGTYVTSVGASSEILEDVLGQGYRCMEVKMMELINVMTRLEQEYTEVSLNVTIQMCISHSIDLSSVQSCLVSVTRPG